MSHWRWVEDWLLSCAAQGLSRRTVVWYGQQVGAVAAAIGALASPGRLDRFLAGERGRGLAPASVDALYRALRAYERWAVGRGLLLPSESMTSVVSRPHVPSKRGRAVSLGEFGAVVGSIDASSWLGCRDRLALWLLMYSGLRQAECVALDVGDVDAAARLVLVRSGKGDKARTVPMCDQSIGALLAYLAVRPAAPGGALLLAADGWGGATGRLSARGLASMLRRRGAAAGVKASAHAYRRGFGVALLNGGANMAAVRDFLGHSSVTTTEKSYAWYTGATLRGVYDAALGGAGRADW